MLQLDTRRSTSPTANEVMTTLPSNVWLVALAAIVLVAGCGRALDLSVDGGELCDSANRGCPDALLNAPERLVATAVAGGRSSLCGPHRFRDLRRLDTSFRRAQE